MRFRVSCAHRDDGRSGGEGGEPARAEEADIVIVNHHLFFADLNIRGNEYGRVLPDYGAVIFDEAHLIEDIAADYFGFQVSSFQIDELVRDVERLPITDVALNRDLTKQSAKIIGLADQFWARFVQGRSMDGRFPLVQGSFAQRTKTGEIEAGDRIEILKRDPNRVTIDELVRLVDQKNVAEIARRAIRVEALPEKWKERLRQILTGKI